MSVQESEFEARKLAATVISIDKQIVWRPIRDTLPEVAPEANTPSAAEAQGAVTSTDQVIIAQPKIPTKSPQYIQGPTNEKEALVSSPNMIGFKDQTTKRAFEPPPAQEAPPVPELLPPPVLASGRSDISRFGSNGLAPSKIKSKPPIRTFNPPDSRSAKVEIPAVLLEQAPALPVTNPLLQSGASSPQLRPRPLPALPNASQSGENRSTGEDAGAVTLAPPPTLQGEINAAIISLTPADSLQQLALGSREGDFSRAPVPGPPRRDDAADGDASKLPGLTIGPPANRSGLENLPARATRNQPPLNTPSLSIPLLPRARQLDVVLERHFQGRNVYITAVPAIAQTSKDLTIWFGEHETVGGRPLIRPPMPLKTMSIRSDSIGHGNSGRILYISGVISTGGRLHQVSVLGDQIGAAELVQALEGWEFSPALRNGVPIEVDIVIGVPLSPPAARAGQ